MIPYIEFTTISVGPITIQAWGLMVAIGFLVGLLISIIEAKRKRIKVDEIYNIAILIFLGAFIGSRILYIILFWEVFSNNLVDVLKIWEGGFIFYGGVIGAVLAGYVYIRIRKLNFWTMADTFAPGLALGIFFGRIGCSLINDHPGAVTDLPWGILWPDGIIRHPVAEYLSLNGLIAFILLWLIRKRITINGALINIFIIYYAVTRFFLDFTRATEPYLPNVDPHFAGLTISQYVSIVIFVISVSWLIKKYLIKSSKANKELNGE